MTNLEQLIECAKVMVVDDSSKEVAAVQSETSELPNLKVQIQDMETPLQHDFLWLSQLKF